jgi:hypothetical protein
MAYRLERKEVGVKGKKGEGEHMSTRSAPRNTDERTRAVRAENGRHKEKTTFAWII